MFPRYRFKTESASNPSPGTDDQAGETKDGMEKAAVSSIASEEIGEVVMPRRTYLQMLCPIHYFADDKTTWFQYFRRPFFLFAFPNIVLSGIQFAFGCTAGIVSFNTISEIMTSPPYNWSPGPAGLIFLAALVGNFIG